MNELFLARALHVLAVVIWIGGVWMVTTIVLPTLRRGQLGADQVLARLFRGHLVLLALASITILGAVAGSHGWSL